MPVAPVPRNIALGKLYDVVSRMLQDGHELLDIDQARSIARERALTAAGNARNCLHVLEMKCGAISV